jgi:hypothetical protein
LLLSGTITKMEEADRRFMIYHDQEMGRDKMFAVYTARLDALQRGITPQRTCVD